MLGKTNVMNEKTELTEITITAGKNAVVKTAEEGAGYSKVTVLGDADLMPENIRDGIEIFGVTGSLQEGIDLLGMCEYGKIAVDTFTPSGSPASVVINHSLGKRPLMVIILGKNVGQNEARFYCSVTFFSESSASQYGSGNFSTRTQGQQMANSNNENAISLVYNNQTSQLQFISNSYPMQAGATYTVITMG